MKQFDRQFKSRYDRYWFPASNKFQFSLKYIFTSPIDRWRFAFALDLEFQCKLSMGMMQALSPLHQSLKCRELLSHNKFPITLCFASRFWQSTCAVSNELCSIVIGGKNEISNSSTCRKMKWKKEIDEQKAVVIKSKFIYEIELTN